MTTTNLSSFITEMNAHFAVWRDTNAPILKKLTVGCQPREIIERLSEELLAHYAGKPLIDPYDVYQHLLDFWSETMQDDCYLIASEGWKAETHRVTRDRQERQGDGTRVGPVISYLKSLIVCPLFLRGTSWH